MSRVPEKPKPVPVECRRLPKRKPKTVIDWQAPPEPWGVGGSAPRRPRRPIPGGPAAYVTTRWPA